VSLDSASCGCCNCNNSAATQAHTLGSTRDSRRCMDSLRIEGCIIHNIDGSAIDIVVMETTCLLAGCAACSPSQSSSAATVMTCRGPLICKRLRAMTVACAIAPGSW
jgi:hypothetical protein